MTRAEWIALMNSPAYADPADGTATVWQVLHDCEPEAKMYSEADVWAATAAALGIDDDPTTPNAEAPARVDSTPQSGVPSLEEQEAAEVDRLSAAWEAWSTT
jgi:hypothetical protein